MNTKDTQYTIDAAGRAIGRIATEAAKALIGKTSADYTPHIPSRVHVSIVNAGRIRMDEKKRLGKKYTHYSGRPGGLKIETLSTLVIRKGNGAAVRKAVERMLPRNTLRNARLKRLTISE